MSQSTELTVFLLNKIHLVDYLDQNGGPTSTLFAFRNTVVTR